MQQDRQQHARGNTDLDPSAKRQHDGGRHRRKIAARIGPCFLQDGKIHKAQHRDDDGGGQRGIGQKIDQRGQRHSRDGQPDCGKGASRGCVRARVKVDDRPGKPARDRKPPGKCCADVGGTQTDQFLIGVDALLFPGRKRLRHRHGFHKPDDRDQHGGHRQLRDQVRGKTGQGEGRQALRNRAHDADAACRQVERPDGHGGQHDGSHWSCLGHHISHSCADTHTPQQGIEPLAHPEQKRGGQDAKDHGDPVRFGQVMPKRA